MKASRSFVLPTSIAAASAGSVAAIRELGWEVLEASPSREHLTVSEDATKLCCSFSPVTIEIRMASAAASSTTVVLNAKVAGWGPVASRSLRGASVTLASRIAEAATRG